MKCSNCGNEFGTGTHCLHCGVDRVTGLANYNGYNNSGDSSSYNSSNFGGSPKTMVCYACSEIIPVGSKFCPVCGKKLLVTCPNCGHEYSSLYPVCSKCGTNREEYNERKRREEEEKKAWEQSPEGRAELAEQKRKEDEQGKKFTYYLIAIPLIGLLYYFIFKELFDSSSITIIISAISGVISSYILYDEIF